MTEQKGKAGQIDGNQKALTELTVGVKLRYVTLSVLPIGNFPPTQAVPLVAAAEMRLKVNKGNIRDFLSNRKYIV